MELAWTWSSSNFRPTRAKFPPFGHLSQLKPTLAKLVCYCYAVTTRSYSDNTELFLASWLDLAASFDHSSLVTWLELARVGSTVWPKALNNQFLSVSHNYRHDAIHRPNRNFHQIKPTKVEGPGVLTVWFFFNFTHLNGRIECFVVNASRDTNAN